MWTIIKLVIALAFLNACAQAGLVAFKFYQFEDAVHEMLLFSGRNASDGELVQSVVNLASEQNVPLDVANVTVRRERIDTYIDVTYDEDVTLVPGLYTKTWTFKPTASVRLLSPQQVSP